MGLPPGALVIDDHRNRAERIDAEERRRLLFAAVQIHRMRPPGEPAFFERHAGAKAVGGGRIVEIDHGRAAGFIFALM